MRAHEFLYKRQLDEDVENFPIANVRRPNGAIGNQGVNTNQAADVLTHAAGMQVSPDMSMRQLVDALKADPAAQQRLRQFVQKNPITVYALPDGTYHLQDGHHRTFLLNLLGDETVPAIVKEDVAESREEFEGMTMEMVKNGWVLVINALDDWGNNVLGHVAFNIGDDNELDPQELEVDERYQGQGIARVMYDYAKSKGYTIHRSYDQTDAGRGFWNKHRGEDVRVWEGVAEGLDAEAYKEHLIKTLPQMMKFLSKNVKGWRPSEEQMLSAIDTAYMVMKHTGDVKQAGKALQDELNTLHRMSQGQQGVAENFADGKNPGRKGLSKRMGVNTKASVSSLRKTAKHSSGEKARMAHWLANMKAGRAKAKRK